MGIDYLQDRKLMAAKLVEITELLQTSANLWCSIPWHVKTKWCPAEILAEWEKSMIESEIICCGSMGTSNE